MLNFSKSIGMFLLRRTKKCLVVIQRFFHHLSIRHGVRPTKQAQRRFWPELISQIEGEINKLIEVGFIREVKYPS